MLTLTPDDILNAEIEPLSKVVGLPNQLFRVKFTTPNILDPSQQIWVTFPFWDPLSSAPSHMLLSPSPTCTGLSSLKTAPLCAYDSQLKVLKLTQGFDET